MTEVEDEQAEILKVIKERVGASGRPWNKYNGDVCCRIIKKHAEKYVPEGCKIVGPNAYAQGIATEFDLIIVDKDATPKKYTNAYPVESIRYVIEVKKRGIYGGHKDLQNTIQRIRKNFTSVTRRNPKTKCAYLTIQEVWKPKRKGSIDYFEETKKGLHPFKVFALMESRTNKPIEGMLKRFISSLQLISDKC